jgi:methionyl-tRNA synthetase
MNSVNKPKRHLITAALPYVNGPIHLGHLAGAYLPADIYSRYLKLKGEDAVFVCGSDEHGAAITLRARKDGITPQALVDKYHTICEKAFADFGIQFDIYHRTSSELHHETASQYFKELLDKGVFTVKESEQYFDEEQQQFLADRYIMGTCPKCGNHDAYGDQCEKCGSSLSPNDLINPRSVLSGSAPVKRKTKHWYLPMAQHGEWLKEWINTGKLDGVEHHNPSEWKNHVVGQCNSWLDGGLHDRAMTRDLDWGVQVPVEGADGKVLYVWLDAPIGYISATKQWAANNGKDWEPYWKDDSTRLVHFIGKDNIVFHCIIFPIILKSHGEYILPQNVPANEFLNLEGDKLSTSRNWAVWLHEYLEDYPDRKDALRYTLCSILPEAKDSEFTWKDFQARNNNELVAILGNFVNRAVVLTHKYYGGLLPKVDPDAVVLEEALSFYGKVGAPIEKFQFRQGLAEAMNLARLGNKYLADNEPWKTIKTDPAAAAKVIVTSLQIAAHLTQVLVPFLPFTAEKLAAMLNLDVHHPWGEAPAVLLPAGHIIGQGELLFTKFEDEDVEKEVAKLQGKSKVAHPQSAIAKQESAPSTVKPNVTFDQFQALDIRIGTILEAKRVRKTDKLLELRIDIGLEVRTVVSGIAGTYAPEDVIGQQVSLLCNLEPRKIKGIESQGMVLMVEDADGKLAFVQPDRKVAEGSGVA